MATYRELYELSLDQTLVQRMTIAVAVAAETIREEPVDTLNHDARVAWAKRAMANPDGMARQMLVLALAHYRASSYAQIQGATDAGLQAAVDQTVALLV